MPSPTEPRRGRRLGLGFIALLLGLLWLTFESRAPLRATMTSRAAAATMAPRGAKGPVGPTPRRVAAPAAPQRIELSDQACRISGYVLDANGQPAADVEVVASAITATAAPASTSGHGEVTTQSDPSGEFTLDVPPGDYALVAYRNKEAGSDGAPEQVSEVLEPLSLRPGERLDGFALRLGTGGVIDGRVVAGGAPVAGQEVCARLHDGDDACASVATSDDDGGFHLTNLPGATLFVSTLGAANSRAIHPPARGVTIELPPRPLIEGQVVDATGAPVSGAVIEVANPHGRRLASAVSDGEGGFRIELREEQAEVLVSARGRGRACPVERLATTTRRLRLVLGAAGSLAGRVVFDGPPLPGWQVQLRCDGVDRGGARLDADGAYRFTGLPPGRCRVSWLRSARAGAAVEVDLVAGEVTAPDLRVPTLRHVHGRVVDGDGGAVAGAAIQLVEAHDGEFQPHAAAISAADGSFDLPTAVTGIVGVQARLGARESSLATLRPDGAIEHAVVLRLAIDGRISGLVRGSDGAPRPDVRVACGDGETLTSPSGRFDLECPIGARRLLVGDRAQPRQVPLLVREEAVTYVEIRL